jgi:hypothetical protein
MNRVGYCIEMRYSGPPRVPEVLVFYLLMVVRGVEDRKILANRLRTVDATGMFGATQSGDWPPEESAPGRSPRGAEKAPQSDDRNASGYCDGKARIGAWSIEGGGSLGNFNENHHDDEKSRVSGLGHRTLGDAAIRRDASEDDGA